MLPDGFTKEGLFFEAKSASDGVPQDFWETYSSFANTFGGRIVLGISEGDDGKLIVTGVSDPDRTVKILWDNLNNPRMVNINLLKNEDIRVDTIDEKYVVIVDVPQADRRIRPVYIKNNINSGTFKRNNEGDYHCRMDEIKQMIRDSSDQSSDRDVIEEYGMETLDNDSIDRFLSEVSARKPGHPWTRMKRDDFLQMVGAAYSIESGLHPTKAGLLMFGRIQYILRTFNGYFLDYRESDASNRWNYRIQSNSGEWGGNIYDFISMVMTRLSIKLGSEFKLDGFSSLGNSGTYMAVREAVINALIHGDYDLSCGTVIELYGDRIEIRNPGTMRVNLKDAYKGGFSDPRNSGLMTLAMAIGWVERAGTGIRTMSQLKDDGDITYLMIEEHADPSMVMVTIGLPFRRIDCRNDKRTVIKDMRNNPNITQKELSERIGVSLRTMSSIISELKDSGRIHREGGRKSGRWVVDDII